MALFDTLSIVKFCLIKLNVYLCIKNNKNIYMEKKLFILLLSFFVSKAAMAAGIDTLLFNRWQYDIKSGDPEAPTYLVSKLLDIKQIL